MTRVLTNQRPNGRCRVGEQVDEVAEVDLGEQAAGAGQGAGGVERCGEHVEQREEGEES